MILILSARTLVVMYDKRGYQTMTIHIYIHHTPFLQIARSDIRPCVQLVVNLEVVT